ncbi:hypothetical protein ACIQU6_04795 [Streptomyces sp. NPDC090442]|uniref:hypothetical protein n=1 Tax=Streptomyces sp. NPDC090442 TaxID=3365962 RepID=UPI0038093AAC
MVVSVIGGTFTSDRDRRNARVHTPTSAQALIERAADKNNGCSKRGGKSDQLGDARLTLVDSHGLAGRREGRSRPGGYPAGADYASCRLRIM